VAEESKKWSGPLLSFQSAHCWKQTEATLLFSERATSRLEFAFNTVLVQDKLWRSGLEVWVQIFSTINLTMLISGASRMVTVR